MPVGKYDRGMSLNSLVRGTQTGTDALQMLQIQEHPRHHCFLASETLTGDLKHFAAINIHKGEVVFAFRRQPLELRLFGQAIGLVVLQTSHGLGNRVSRVRYNEEAICGRNPNLAVYLIHPEAGDLLGLGQNLQAGFDHTS